DGRRLVPRALDRGPLGRCPRRGDADDLAAAPALRRPRPVGPPLAVARDRRARARRLRRREALHAGRRSRRRSGRPRDRDEALGAAVFELPGRARTVGVVALALVVAAGFTQQWHRVSIADESQSPAELAAARVLERVTRPGDVVVSDLPVSAVLAHRLVPG